MNTPYERVILEFPDEVAIHMSGISFPMIHRKLQPVFFDKLRKGLMWSNDNLPKAALCN